LNIDLTLPSVPSTVTYATFVKTCCNQIDNFIRMNQVFLQ